MHISYLLVYKFLDVCQNLTICLITIFLRRDSGHFTQIAWANSYRLGCSVNVQFVIPDFKTTIMCDYGPAGNILNTPVYKIGKGCSDCPVGTECSKRFPGLCAMKCSKLYPFFCEGNVISVYEF